MRHKSKDDNLKFTRDNQLSDRRTASANAKSALLDAYQAAQTSDPEVKAERLAERARIAAEREERRLERERVKLEEKARLEAEAAEKEAAAYAAARAEIDARESEEKARVARVIEDEAARKAARDLRYANRKAARG